MKSDHDTVANIYRSLARTLPDHDCEFAIQALADALRDLATRHYAGAAEAKVLSVAAIREVFAVEVSEVAVGPDETAGPGTADAHRSLREC